MTLSMNFATRRQQTSASRSEMNIDVGLMTVLLHLSILSPSVFGGSGFSSSFAPGRRWAVSPLA